MIKIFSTKTNTPIEYKHFFFGGGEQHVQLLDCSSEMFEDVTIWLHYSQDNDLLKLALIVDALRLIEVERITLKLPYFPGARQDRVCNAGEPLSVKVYANFINSLKFNKVVIFDPHSCATPVAIDNVKVIDNIEFVCQVLADQNRLTNAANNVLVSPDAGSNKKVADVAKHIYKTSMGVIPVVRADKLREVSTGKIIETTVYADSLVGKDCYILDDICSKGGTFCALAKALRDKGASKVYLVVSHYEGTADIAVLKAAGIDKVFTTDSKPFVTRDDTFLEIKDIKMFM